jgi:hypothetical protein
MPGVDPATLTLPDAGTGKITLGLCAHPSLHDNPAVGGAAAVKNSDLGGFDGHSLFVRQHPGRYPSPSRNCAAAPKMRPLTPHSIWSEQ